MFGYARFDPARMIFGNKEAMKLALLKVGVTVVLRIGSFVQRRTRTSPVPLRTRLPAA